MGPGQRIDAIVIGPPVGEYAIQTIPFQNQTWRAPDPAQQIATVIASGPQTFAKTGGTEILGQQVKGPRWIDEIRKTPIDRRRTLNYSRTDDRQVFMIDGHVMDENR